MLIVVGGFSWKILGLSDALGLVEPASPWWFDVHVRYPRWSREPTALSGVFSLLPGSYLIGVSHFPDSGLDVLSSSFRGSPWRPILILSLGCEVSGSAEPALVLYALGTEHLPRCSHMDSHITFFCCDTAVSSALNRFVQLDAPFAITFVYLHGLFHLLLRLYWRGSVSTGQLYRPGRAPS